MRTTLRLRFAGCLFVCLTIVAVEMDSVAILESLSFLQAVLLLAALAMRWLTLSLLKLLMLPLHGHIVSAMWQ